MNVLDSIKIPEISSTGIKATDATAVIAVLKYAAEIRAPECNVRDAEVAKLLLTSPNGTTTVLSTITSAELYGGPSCVGSFHARKGNDVFRPNSAKGLYRIQLESGYAFYRVVGAFVLLFPEVVFTFKRSDDTWDQIEFSGRPQDMGKGPVTASWEFNHP